MPNFVVIRHLLHVIHAFFMNISGIFPQIDRGFSIMTSLSVTSQSLYDCECFSCYILSITTSVPIFVALDLQRTEKSRGGGADSTLPPSGTRDFWSPVEIGLKDHTGHIKGSNCNQISILKGPHLDLIIKESFQKHLEIGDR